MKIHPLFSEVFSDLATRGWFAETSVLYEWDKAGRPVVEEEPESSARIDRALQRQMDVDAAFWKEELAAKDARIAELEKALASEKAKRLEKGEANARLSAELVVERAAAKGLRAEVVSLTAKLAGVRDGLTYETAGEIRTTALEEAAKEAEQHDGGSVERRYEAGEIARHIRALKKP